jgi:hypothetical protein
MTHQEIEVTNIDGSKQNHIIIDLGDGAFKSFPADENNPEYMAWLNPEPPVEPETPKSKK